MRGPAAALPAATATARRHLHAAGPASAAAPTTSRAAPAPAPAKAAKSAAAGSGTPPPLTPDDACRDEGLPAQTADCKALKASGYCAKPWIAAFCAASCGKCGGNANVVGRDVNAQYDADVAARANALLAATPAANLSTLLFPFSSAARTTSRQSKNTDPRFAAYFGRSQPWGTPQCGMSLDQVVAMHEMLDTALSTAGYLHIIAVMTQQTTIGEMEDAADRTVPLVVNNTFNGKRYFNTVAAGQRAAGLPTGASQRPPVTQGAVVYVDPANLTTFDWYWAAPNPPGLVKRILNGFCSYSITIFGNPGSDAWGFRLEGRKVGGGKRLFSATPMLLGSLPIVVAPVYLPNTPLTSSQWARSRGQRLLARSALALRKFWLALPKATRDKALIPAETYAGPPPFANSVPAPNQFVGTDNVREAALGAVTLNATRLSTDAAYQLEEAMELFLASMPSALQQFYLSRLQGALDGTGASSALVVAWAGDADLVNAPYNTEHYSFIKIAGLQFEYLQSPQFTVTFPGLESVHVHTVFRDLESAWDYDALTAHELRDHVQAADCVDVAPPGGFTCAQQAAWDKCGEPWMQSAVAGARPYGYCARTCGACPMHKDDAAALAAASGPFGLLASEMNERREQQQQQQQQKKKAQGAAAAATTTTTTTATTATNNKKAATSG